MFDITDHEKNHLSAILLDLYYYTLQFARDNQFSKEQTSALFSIVKRTHEACVGQELNHYYRCWLTFCLAALLLGSLFSS